ncbi:MAG TPA: signal peptidase I [Pyrinomonadaceae bacterium]|nr:signal peptidase I [Pyrinomonadaceae bacterium]
MSERRGKGGGAAGYAGGRDAPPLSKSRAEVAKAEAAGRRKEGGAPPEPPRPLWREYAESAVVVAVMALFFMTFVGQAATVPTASMQNTILVGDHFLINKFIFAPGPHVPFLPQRDIRRGDIIVFKYPSDIDTNEQVVRFKTNYIKRVIGMPGDTIEVRGAQVLINGTPLAEHRVESTVGRDARNRLSDKAELEVLQDPPRREGEPPYSVYYSPETMRLPPDRFEQTDYFNFAVNGRPVVVPENNYFVMGDSREFSSDSRRWGFVPRHLVVGRALFVIWSYDESAASGNFFSDFFRNTRWRRTGTVLR